MNNQRIAAIVTSILDSIDRLEIEWSAERDYYDDMPESIRAGAKGGTSLDAADAMESAWRNLDSALADLRKIQ